MQALISSKLESHKSKVLQPSVKIISVVTLTVVLWVLLGVLFYSNVIGWTYYTAFFYAVQAGLSVGYGRPNEPHNDLVHLFSTCYILAGSALVATSMCVFIGWASTVKSQLEIDLKIPTPVYLKGKSGYITPLSIVSYCWFKWKLMVGWYSNPSRVIKLSALLIWLTLGILYGVFYARYSFLTALYFAVSSCSTAGLLGPECLNYSKDDDGVHCDIGDVPASFVGFYILIGIPVYAVALGEIGSILVGDYLSSVHEDHQGSSAFTVDQFVGFKEIFERSDKAHDISRAEFVLLELSRMGKISSGDIEQILEKFDAVDTDHSGDLSFEELVSSGIAKVVESRASAKRRLHQPVSKAISFLMASSTRHFQTENTTTDDNRHHDSNVGLSGEGHFEESAL